MALKNFKKAGKKAPVKSYRASRTEPEPREERQESRGRDNRSNGGGRKDVEFERVSGLFPGKKEGSYSAFISYDMEKQLRDLRGGDKAHPGDIIGVSEDDEGKLYLWIGKRS